jgi:chromosome segregation ATPase
MEFEDIAKRLEWLDDQQRKSKQDSSDQTGRLNSLETSLNALTQQVKALSGQINDLVPAAARMNQFDQMLTRSRADLGKMLDAAEKNSLRRDQEAAKLQNVQFEEMRKTMAQLSTLVSAEESTKKDRAHEAQRLAMTVQDIRTASDQALQHSKAAMESQKLFEESHRQDAKRLVDIQGELAAVRKRADEAREKTTLHSDALRGVENRINELLETETSRQERQAAFLQQQALAQVERDRSWKEWQEKYEVFRQQAETMEAQLAGVDESVRAAKRAQDGFDDLSLRLERRVAEVSEMQRLGEDRVRQEWVAFKSEEQKRWTGYSLAQDEAMRDLRKDLDNMDKRLTTLDDTAQVVQDQLHQTADTTEKQLQELMNIAHEWVSAYERIMGHVKTKARKAAH